VAVCALVPVIGLASLGSPADNRLALTPLANRSPVYCLSKFKIAKAEQPIAPIRRILPILSSNQWLV
jgi:hypothetical protein